MTGEEGRPPSALATLVFTDIEGSSKLLHELGTQAYADALTEHRRVLRDAIARHEGVEVDTQGDAFFIVFPTAPGAARAAAEAQESLENGDSVQHSCTTTQRHSQVLTGTQT